MNQVPWVSSCHEGFGRVRRGRLRVEFNREQGIGNRLL